MYYKLTFANVKAILAGKNVLTNWALVDVMENDPLLCVPGINTSPRRRSFSKGALCVIHCDLLMLFMLSLEINPSFGKAFLLELAWDFVFNFNEVINIIVLMYLFDLAAGGRSMLAAFLFSVVVLQSILLVIWNNRMQIFTNIVIGKWFIINEESVVNFY